MNREDYLREIEAAAIDLHDQARDLAAAANPLQLLRHGIARDWKWWLPGASLAGAGAALLLRGHSPKKKHQAANGVTAPATGAAFWVPTLVKLLPALLSQLVPLFLSVRAGRK